MAVRELPKGTEIFFFFLNLKSSLGACSRQLMKFIFFLYIYPAECIAPFLYWLLFIWVADFGVDAPSLRSVLLCHVGITWVEEAIKSKLTSIEKPCQNFQKLSVCVCAQCLCCTNYHLISHMASDDAVLTHDGSCQTVYDKFVRLHICSSWLAGSSEPQWNKNTNM